ncbi:hypothetical protein BGZ60DRAFT_429385 [Tricladium varicosporioides]|nr:hypothetical protein BGZ60DRAFT_429385 [Hymenoscyphus varicosporioides]
MSQTETRFITEDAYRALRTKQDNDIQGEFARQAVLIGNGNKQLRDELSSLSKTFDNRLASVNGTLGGRLVELSNELLRVKGDIQQLKDEVGQVKDEVGQVKDEVGQVKDEVGQVKDEVGEIKTRLNQMEGRSFNRARFLPWHSISSIGIYRPGVGFTLPDYFPATIKDFWNLQSPAQEEKLIYLLRFYDIQGYQYWGQTNHVSSIDDGSSGKSGSQSDSDDSSQQDLSFEDAVRSYPHVAIDELGSRLGLVLEDIRNFFKRAARRQQQHQRPAIKRLLVAANKPESEVVKRSKKSELQASLKDMPIREPVNTRSTKSPSEKLQWDVSANKEVHAQLVARMEAARSHSTKSSKDSTTDIIPSQELRDLGVSGKKRSDKGP